MIINIRGTSGSGKTYTVKQFMAAYAPDITVKNDKGKVIAHCVYYKMQPVYLIGSYANVCGGCDSITSQDMVCSLVRHFSIFGHVVFEGLIMSHLYARYKALYEELTDLGEKFVFAFMDTSLQICLDRVQQRRTDRGDGREFNPQNTIGKYESIQVCVEKFNALNFDVRYIDHTADPISQITAMLDEDRDLAFENSYHEESFR